LFDLFGNEIEALANRFSLDLRNLQTKRAESLAKQNTNRNGQLVSILQKAQAKLAVLEITEPTKVLEADLEPILAERGCPIPGNTGLTVSAQKTGTPSSAKSKKSKLSSE
jgi:hypothetical protein